MSFDDACPRCPQTVLLRARSTYLIIASLHESAFRPQTNAADLHHEGNHPPPRARRLFSRFAPGVRLRAIVRQTRYCFRNVWFCFLVSYRNGFASSPHINELNDRSFSERLPTVICRGSELILTRMIGWTFLQCTLRDDVPRGQRLRL